MGIVSSWWVLLVAAMVFAAGSSGCAQQYGDRDPAPADAFEDPEEEIPGPNPASTCPGKCRTVPPAPFNDRIHLVYLAPAGVEPECPSTAPLRGMLAQVLSMGGSTAGSRGQPEWVLECLTSSHDDACDEGTTCAPLPPEDYELCISRENDGPCPGLYYPEHVVVQEPGEPVAPPFTLCCTHTKRRE